MSNSHKSTQKGLAPAYGPRCAQVSLTPVPLRGHAVTGHPWPNTALPASMPVDPLRRTCARPPEGQADQKPVQKQDQRPAEAAYRPTCLAKHISLNRPVGNRVSTGVIPRAPISPAPASPGFSPHDRPLAPPLAPAGTAVRRRSSVGCRLCRNAGCPEPPSP